VEVVRLEAQGGLATQRRAREAPRGRVDEETRAAEAVVRQLSVPWATLIAAIEQTATKEVAILQLQPDVEQGVLRLTAEARRREAMFDYLRRLSAAKGLSEVHLVSHQVQETDPQRPVQFAVQAVMREAR
jgi:Tfp pilus assembly protein PilN